MGGIFLVSIVEVFVCRGKFVRLFFCRSCGVRVAFVTFFLFAFGKEKRRERFLLPEEKKGKGKRKIE